MDPIESFSDVIRFVQRMLAEIDEFCAGGAPEFRNFCNSFVNFFARISRNLDAGRALFGSEQPSAATLREFCSARCPNACIFCCERHAEIREVLQFFREVFAQSLRDLDAKRALFRI